MTAIGPFAIPILAVATFAATLGWFGYQHMTRPAPAATPAVAQPETAGRSPSPQADQTRTDTPGATAGDRTEARTPPGASRPNGSPASAPPSDAAAPPIPAFDVVRVEPGGDTVVAGRALPGANVELLLNGARQSRVVADPSGLFALVPEPLPPGSHELVLQTTNGDGTKMRSPQSVTVVVAANRKDPPLVTITTPGQPAVVLSRPDGAATTAQAEPRPGKAAQAPAQPGAVADAAKASGEAQAKTRRPVQIVSVETEGAGRLLVSASAAPAAVVRLYLNETFIAPASAGADGRVAFSIERGMRPGAYKVRLDDVDTVSGQVRTRAEVPFAMPQQVARAVVADQGPPVVASRSDESRRADAPAGRLASAAGPEPATSAPSSPTVVVPEINTALVSRGDSLWAISKRAYGEGLRYTVIYGANAGQIRDPDLIYPGQMFVLPVNNGGGVQR